MSGGRFLDPRSDGRVRVKFCGIAVPADARRAAALEADAIGLVFYPDSPRAVDVARARAIIEVLPPEVSRVGLFVDALPGEIEHVLERIPLDLLQFHGSETPDACARYSMPYLKAVRLRSELNLAETAAAFSSAFGILLDSYVPGASGGTGRPACWTQDLESDLDALAGFRVVLAGGLRPETVAAEIARRSPYAVDVSSGIETAPGEKDPARMAAFMKAVRQSGNTAP